MVISLTLLFVCAYVSAKVFFSHIICIQTPLEARAGAFGSLVAVNLWFIIKTIKFHKISDISFSLSRNYNFLKRSLFKYVFKYI